MKAQEKLDCIKASVAHMIVAVQLKKAWQKIEADNADPELKATCNATSGIGYCATAAPYIKSLLRTLDKQEKQHIEDSLIMWKRGGRRVETWAREGFKVVDAA